MVGEIINIIPHPGLKRFIDKRYVSHTLYAANDLCIGVCTFDRLGCPNDKFSVFCAIRLVFVRNVAKKIENELDYPGQIKVSVIRESRATEYAK